MTRRIHSTTQVKKPPTQADIDAAFERLKKACVTVATILDDGVRDPTWAESQELENAAIALGRLIR